MNEQLLTVGEVAALFRVSPRTVARWLGSGRLTRVNSPGGMPRIRESECAALLAEAPQ